MIHQLELYESDILSIRGFGRFKVIACRRKNQKDKVRLLTGKLNNISQTICENTDKLMSISADFMYNEIN